MNQNKENVTDQVDVVAARGTTKDQVAARGTTKAAMGDSTQGSNVSQVSTTTQSAPNHLLNVAVESGTLVDNVTHTCSSPIAASVKFPERVDKGGDSGSNDADIDRNEIPKDPRQDGVSFVATESSVFVGDSSIVNNKVQVNSGLVSQFAPKFNATTSDNKPPLSGSEDSEDEVDEYGGGFLDDMEDYYDEYDQELCMRVFKGWDWTSNGSFCSSGSHIILGWNVDAVDLNVVAMTDQVVHTFIRFKADKKELFCSYVYAHNRYTHRRPLWDNLGLHNQLVRNHPWYILGDFKSALNLEDKVEGSSIIDIAMREFKECVDANELVDINR
ncbi:RNA-directed DNA polymerase, eukaryota, Reverse transcriptase zinc-binding domain protein [Artemisia annua]|uniref:RNA-directed DNA polymerase, eukaryota, Reverse transcriptase zinc-binding domain protein n=1 Tax=Artemisia annua TaxID=35608 RepID=A0A2U1MQU6_ARTAN|nr:RNA-directed DNA polymerase, eukaryota, Reverse transcriptase zinc-binding domain protein [Artemisia annua]